MRDEADLDKRRRDVLAAIVRQYVSTGNPVGSKAVAEQFPELVSSATIRNLMAELEAEGYLGQPHISAGRVPTDKAYRFFVDQMAGPKRLGRATERYIDESLSQDISEPEQLMAKTSRVLSRVSHQVGLVLGPALEEKLLEHIKFVKLPDNRVLVVIVSKPDLVEDKILRLEEEFTQEELDRTADYLNTEFRGCRCAPSAWNSTRGWNRNECSTTACSRTWPRFSCGERWPKRSRGLSTWTGRRRS